jgi:uncharacterized integral membrane protein
MARDESSPPQRRDQTRLVASLILAGVVVAFAVLNVDDVRVHWILGEWNTPLIFVIVVSLAIGVLFGALAARRRDRGR